MAHRAIRKFLKKLPVHLKRAAKGHDSEQVHKLRVKCRKACAALKLYSEFVPEKKARRLDRKLAKILHATGAPRDLGVMAKHQKGVFAALARKEIKAASRPLEKAARHSNRKHLERMIAGVIKEARDFVSEAPPLPFRSWVRPKIREFIDEFLAARPAKDASLKDLHKFRIHGKELRYAIEISQKAFAPAYRQHVLNRMEMLQEKLGKINDLFSENGYFAEWSEDPKNSGIAAQLHERIAANKLEIARRREAFEKWCSPDFMRKFGSELEKMLSA